MTRRRLVRMHFIVEADATSLPPWPIVDIFAPSLPPHEVATATRLATCHFALAAIDRTYSLRWRVRVSTLQARSHAYMWSYAFDETHKRWRRQQGRQQHKFEEVLDRRHRKASIGAIANRREEIVVGDSHHRRRRHLRATPSYHWGENDRTVDDRRRACQPSVEKQYIEGGDKGPRFMER